MCTEKVHTGLRSADGKKELTDIRYTTGLFDKVFNENKEYFERTLGLCTYKERYASDPTSPMTGAEELDANNWEWRRLMSVNGGVDMPLLCCPEDIERSDYCKHSHNHICKYCRVPVCDSCEGLLRRGRGIPMALGNDNMWMIFVLGCNAAPWR